MGGYLIEDRVTPSASLNRLTPHWSWCWINTTWKVWTWWGKELLLQQMRYICVVSSLGPFWLWWKLSLLFCGNFPMKTVGELPFPKSVNSGRVMHCGVCISAQDFKPVVQPRKEASRIANRKKYWFPAVSRITYLKKVVGGAASKEPFSLSLLSASWNTHGFIVTEELIFLFSHVCCWRQPIHISYLLARWFLMLAVAKTNRILQ